MLIRSWRRGSRPTDGTLKESENRLMIRTVKGCRRETLQRPIRMRAKAINKTIRLELSNINVSLCSVRSSWFTSLL